MKSHLFSYKSVVVLCLLLAVAALLLTAKNSQLTSDASRISNALYKSQQQQGKSCGLITSKEASEILQVNAVFTDGTIIDSNSPTAASRIGSPRVDSCSHVAEGSNGTYIDVVVKTYQSPELAKAGFKDETKSVLLLENKSLPIANDLQEVTYAAGVHYVLYGNYSMQISASKIGAAVGKDQEVFSEEITIGILQKL